MAEKRESAWVLRGGGWYWNEDLGGICFESAESAPVDYVPARGWWWYPPEGANNPHAGPFARLQLAKEYAEDMIDALMGS